MADKDQFTFEDDDDFPNVKAEEQVMPPESDSVNEEFFFDSDDEESPEPSEVVQEDPAVSDLSGDEGLFDNDLGAVFVDGEEEADDPVVDIVEPQTNAGGDSKKRTLLMVLLLVLVGGGGAYYFMGQEDSTPSVPTVQIPAEKPVKAVALPPKPAKAPVAQAPQGKVVPAAQPVAVTVPPPPAPAPAAEVAKAETKPVPVTKPVVKTAAETSKPVSLKQPGTQVVVPVPVPVPTPASVKQKAEAVASKTAAQVTPVAAKTAPNAAPVTKVVAASPSPAKTVSVPKPVVAPKQVAAGAFTLDAGSYLLESNRNSLVAKIKKLGYEPFVTPVDATLDMTRLRVGTYSKTDVQDALAFSRSIEPGSYSSPAGDGYVIYAGTFLKSRNVEKLKERFLAEGIKVKAEPVQVVRTLSRIRFGSFATKADATAAASSVSTAGIKDVVVKAK